MFSRENEVYAQKVTGGKMFLRYADLIKDFPKPPEYGIYRIGARQKRTKEWWGEYEDGAKPKRRDEEDTGVMVRQGVSESEVLQGQ